MIEMKNKVGQRNPNQCNNLFVTQVNLMEKEEDRTGHFIISTNGREPFLELFK